MTTHIVPAKYSLLCLLFIALLYLLNVSTHAANHDRLLLSDNAELLNAPVVAPLFTSSRFTGYVKGNNVGLVNATVSLLDANNTVIATGMTDADGLYSILITTPTCTVPPPAYRTTATVPTWTMNKDGGTHVGCPLVFPPNSVVFADIVMVRVIAVQWEAVYTGQLEVNPADLGGGDRMFPDKHTPSDNPTTSRRVIKIVAGITQPQAVANIYVKVFDVDDPTTSLEVDPNGILGTDNRGIDSSPMQTTIQVTGGNPSGFVFFNTTMYAGDNFVVAASTDLNYLNGITVDGTALKDAAGSAIPIEPETPSTAKRTKMLTVWRRLHIEDDSMGIVANNFATGTLSSANLIINNVTELTTNLTFGEVNQFESGSINILGLGTYSVIGNGDNLVIVQANLTTQQVAGKSFTLYDDDDFDKSGMNDADNGTNVEPIKGTFVLMQESDDKTKNVFAAAYIMPIRDGAGNIGNTNNDTNIAFNQNIELNPTNTAPYDSQIALGKNSANVESDDYWVAYLQVGYQGPVTEDADPNYSGGIFDTYTAGVSKTTSKVDSVTGTTQNPPVMPLGADDSFAFVEVERDALRFLGISSIEWVAPHEIGHQFGLKGDTTPAQPGDPNDYGIMSYGSTLEFVPKHVNVLRWRKKSTGH